MNYSLYLRYETDMDLNMRNEYPGALCELMAGEIMYIDGATELTDEEEEDNDEEESDEQKIGIMGWLLYNQTLARLHGIDMTRFPLLRFKRNADALMELDFPNLTQETIDAVGPATNQNIAVIHSLGIAAPFRKKGLGQKVLTEFAKQMLGKCGYIVVLNPQPPQCKEGWAGDSLYEANGVELTDLETDPEKAQWKLYAFLQRCGFRPFKQYENVFVCNVEQTVQELMKMNAPVTDVV